MKGISLVCEERRRARGEGEEGEEERRGEERREDQEGYYQSAADSNGTFIHFWIMSRCGRC